jgi:adenylate cyclase
MSRLFKAVILGSLTGAVGVVGSLVPLGLDLEENVGLDLLFDLRGIRQPPPDVMIVTLDQKSAENLNLPKEPRKWPRSLHARLVENLNKRGASVIAFDLNFEEAKSNEEDNLFAEALHRARNVVLCEYLKREKAPLSSKGGSRAGSLNIERVVPPIPPLAKSAVALAPFPLPKVPVKVAQYWTFKTEAGDAPTMPVVVFQIFTMNVYEEFIHLLEKVSPSRAARLLRDKDAMMDTRSVENTIQDLRGIFEEETFLGERMIRELENKGASSADPKKIQAIKSLIKMYQTPNSQYLNFYGPPGTIPTISYYQVLQLPEEVDPRQQRFDFSGKAVFVGLLERWVPEQKDGFHTVYSQSSGLDLSGVEIAATAFANLLEDMPVQPLSLGAQMAVISFWGLALGMVCYFLPTLTSALSSIGMALLYLGVSAHQFNTTGHWYPLVLPLLFQTPLCFFGALVWKTIDVNRERQNIRKALRYYVPDRVVDQLARNVQDLRASKQRVYGICLLTDAADYTALSENMDPEDLSNFMNTYYEVLLKPIKHYGGTITGIVGDSILALWKAEKPDPALRNQACQAALDIAKGVDQFNQSYGKLELRTRIGLHCGYLLLDQVDAFDHYEHHAIGDIVNTASRIEGLNKYLGTQILVSDRVIQQLDGFLSRALGEFRLAGKTKPLLIYELVCRVEESNQQQKEQCVKFAEILNAYRKRSWEEATEKFQDSVRIFGEDGPSVFYLELCKQLKENPPEESWDGVVCIAQK